MRIIRRGASNPMIVAEHEDVLAFLRKMADDAGFADRESCMVQITVEHPFEGGTTFHSEVPELTLMVSCIEGSRKVSGIAAIGREEAGVLRHEHVAGPDGKVVTKRIDP
jgi:hypothetical protein